MSKPQSTEDDVQRETFSRLSHELDAKIRQTGATLRPMENEYFCDLTWEGGKPDACPQKVLQIRKEVERKFPNVRGGVGSEAGRLVLRFRVYPEALAPRPPSSKDRYRALAEVLPSIRRMIPRSTKLTLHASTENALAPGFAMQAPSGESVRIWLDPQIVHEPSQAWRMNLRVGDSGVICPTPKNKLQGEEIVTAFAHLCDLSCQFRLARVTFVGGDADGQPIAPPGWTKESWARGQQTGTFLPESAMPSLVNCFANPNHPQKVVLVCPWHPLEKLPLTTELDARLAALTDFHVGPLTMRSMREDPRWGALLAAGDAMIASCAEEESLPHLSA
jgi:hypothetical protein